MMIPTTDSATLSRILDAALATLARRGVRKLSMTDVGHQAGISRGTLYRYFNGKADLLDAIAGHVQQGLQKDLTAAVEERPALDARIGVVVEAIVNYGMAHPEAIQVMSVEPRFAMEFVKGVFPDFVSVTEELLAPALELTPAVRSGALSCRELSQLILRVAASTFYIPTGDLENMPRAVAALPCLCNADVA